MGLLNDVKATDKAAGTATDAPKNEKKAKAKARKAAKREALNRVLDYLKAHPVKDLEEDVKTLTVVERTGGFAPSLTPEILFGADLKKGSKISALDVFQKHQKGYPEMRKFMKKWAEKGINVTLDAATQSYVLNDVAKDVANGVAN